MLHCPKCQSADIHRSRTRSTWEQWRKRFSSERLYRCSSCEWRGWGPDTGQRFDDEQRQMAAMAIAADAPDLEAAPIVEPAATVKLPDLSELDEPLKVDRTGPLDLDAVDSIGVRKS